MVGRWRLVPWRKLGTLLQRLSVYGTLGSLLRAALCAVCAGQCRGTRTHASCCAPALCARSRRRCGRGRAGAAAQRRFARTSSRIGGAPSSLPRRPARRKAGPGAAHDQYAASQREHRRAEDGAHVGVVHLLSGGLRAANVRLRSLATSVFLYAHASARTRTNTYTHGKAAAVLSRLSSYPL